MVYGRPQKTFKQKVKSFFTKLGLAAAFAAAVGGTGYNYYGTEEQIDAKVKSVDVQYPKDPNESPRMVIHTDQGTFVNETTRFHLKGKNEVLEIGKALKPGSQVKLTVYGLDPHVGKYSREDIHFYRNIIKVHLQTPPEPLPVPQAGRPASERLLPQKENWNAPAFHPALVGPFAEQDQTLAEVNVFTSDLTGVKAIMPEIARDLSTMSRLPLTGYGIYNALVDPANAIETAVFPVPKGQGSTSSYQDRHVRIARGSGTHTSFHEYFHAWQDMTRGQYTMFDLTMKDAVIANLLKEASAVAFEISSEREAQNHNVPYTGPRVYQEGNVIMTTKSPSSDPENIKAFNTAYDRSWAENATVDAATREAYALAAGGQAVINRLLSGQDQSWRFTYVQVAVANINNNLPAFTATGNEPGYAAKRDAVFEHEGRVSSKLNFVPGEYLGQKAPAQIEKTFDGMGFRLEKNSAESTPVYKFIPKTAGKSAPALPATTAQKPAPKAPAPGMG